ncbi:MAG: hypothetical protein QOG34_2434 [Frankiaceae bacterium]|jgi:hypothetical protein|nr:hypothetical protein [Frankiaceae bacterium]
MAATRRLVLPTTVGVAVISLMSGCGGSGAHPAAATAGDASRAAAAHSAPPSVVPSTVSSPRASNSPQAPNARSRPGSTPAPEATYPQYVQGTKEAPVTVALDRACTTTSGAQVLTVSAPGGFYLSVDAQYSDQNDGRKYGGYYVGKIPASGTYRLPWVVAPSAPLGKVTVWISVEGGKPVETAFRQPTFVVAKSCH